MVDLFEEELRRIGKSKNTIEAYTRDVKQFKVWLADTLGQETNVITATDIKEYRQFLNIIKKLNVVSINRKLKSVVLYQRFLCTLKVCKDEVKLRDVLQKNNIEQQCEVKVVEKQDQYRLKRTIEASGNKRDIMIYYILFGTGIRCSELVALELSDLFITERNGRNNYSYLLIRNGKGNKSRKVNLNAEVVASIKEYLNVRVKCNDEKLLHGQRGALTRLAINKILSKYAKKAQLEYSVAPHMARHTFCTALIKQGVDIKTVCQLAGDSSTDVIYKFYVNSSSEDKQNAVDNLRI